jgi:hypothetical protein
VSSSVHADSSSAQCSEGACTGITFTRSQGGIQVCVTVTSNYATTENPYSQGLQLELKPSGYPYFFTPASSSTSCN